MKPERKSTGNGIPLALGRLLACFAGWLRPPRFTRYLPATRRGTRRLERRLLRRLDGLSQETAR